MQVVIDTTNRVTANELRKFIERIERLDAEKKDISDQQKEVLAEAKGRGYDIKVIRKLITLRRRDQGEVAEEEAVLELYKAALGMSQEREENASATHQNGFIDQYISLCTTKSF